MQSPDEMYQEAISLENDEKYKLKIEKLENLLRNYPDFAPAHDGLGAIYYQLGIHDNALKHFEKAVNLDPKNVGFQKNLADFYYTVFSRREDALLCYKKVIALDSSDVESYFVAANLLVSLHRFEEATQLYQKILELEPWRSDIQEILEKLNGRDGVKTADTTDEMYRISQKLFQSGDIKGAIKILEKIIGKEPENALAYNDLGVLRFQIGEIEQAQTEYEKAVSLDPENILFKKNLAEYYLLVKGEIAKALEQYLTILQDHPFDIETLMASARISEKVGKLDNARVFYEAILDIEPWNMEASERLEALEAYEQQTNQRDAI